jgi:hypothetical protein
LPAYDTIIPLKHMQLSALLRRKLAIYAALAVALAHVFWPLDVYAGNTDVCGAGRDNCNKFVNDYINPFILLLTAMVGIVAVISIIIAGIQYASSADDPGAVTKAKQRIFNTVVGLVAYIFLFAFLNYLIPGGIL